MLRGGVYHSRYLPVGYGSSNIKNIKNIFNKDSCYNNAIQNIITDTLNNPPTINSFVGGEKLVVGNTVLDNLLPYKEKCEYGNKVLVTLHRRENHEQMSEWFKAVNDLAKQNSELEFILPLHPSPNVQQHKHLLNHINVLDPLPHSMLLDILVKSKLVISDSGGLQEEASFFNKKVIVCRQTTERPEGKNSGHLIMCQSPKELCGIFYNLEDNYKIEEKCPYGDGESSIKVKKILDEKL